MNHKVVADPKSSDGKRGEYVTGGVMHSEFNYENAPDGYVQILGYGTNPIHHNIRGVLLVLSGGAWPEAGDYVWIPYAVGSFKKLPIKSQYRNNPDLSYRFMCRANTNEKIGTYNVNILASAAWDVGR